MRSYGDDVVRAVLGLVDGMRDDEHRHALTFQGTQQRVDAGDRRFVQTGGRLVHDEHTRAACDDARDGDEPLLPARQVERRTVGEMLDMQHPQRLLYAGGHLQLAQMLVAWAVRHILGDGVSEQLTLRMLHDIADVAPQGRAFFSGECARPFPVFRRRDRQSGHGDRSGGRAVQGAQQTCERGLAGAVGTHQRHDFAFGDAQRKILENRGVAIVITI